MMGGDEVGCIVLDVGSGYTKVGFAGEDAPKGCFPSACGVVHNLEDTDMKVVSSSRASAPGESSDKETGKAKKYFVGDSQRKYKQNQEIIHPVQNGLVKNWDALEDIVHYSLKQWMHVDPREHPLMVSEPYFNPAANRAKMLELMFEKFEVPGIYLAKDAMLASFSVGKPTSLVLDIGAGVSSAVPVNDGFVLHKAAQATKFAGNVLDEVLQSVLFKKGEEVKPLYSLKREQVDGKIQAKTISLPGVTPSYHNFMIKELMRDIKENHCRVSDIAYLTTQHVQQTTYELPDGTQLQLGGSKLLTAEVLFNPDITATPSLSSQPSSSNNQPLYSVSDDINPNSKFKGLPEMVYSAIDSCDVDIRKELYSNLVLCGGGSLLPGLPKRLNKEVTDILPSVFKVKMTVGSSNNESKFAVWTGGSVLGSLGSFHQKWYSKAEYAEMGSSRLATKCP